MSFFVVMLILNGWLKTQTKCRLKYGNFILKSSLVMHDSSLNRKMKTYWLRRNDYDILYLKTILMLDICINMSILNGPAQKWLLALLIIKGARECASSAHNQKDPQPSTRQSNLPSPYDWGRMSGQWGGILPDRACDAGGPSGQTIGETV